MTSRLKSGRGSSTVRPCSKRKALRVTRRVKFPDKGPISGPSKSTLDVNEGKVLKSIEHTLINICTIHLNFTGYQQLLRGLKLRKLLQEDDWKAVFGKTERTV